MIQTGRDSRAETVPLLELHVNRAILAAFVILLAVGSMSPAQQRPTAFVGAQLVPIDGPPIEDGVLLVHEGRIVDIGPAGRVTLPDDVERIDAAGRIIMPGLICTHSHLGGGWGGDSSAPIQPDCRIFDSINIRDSGFKRAQAGGLTTLNVMPGSGHLLSGQTIYIKVKNVGTIDEAVIRDAEGNILGGMKMANGTNSQRSAPFPGTRAKSAALVRGQFVKAQAYREKLSKAKEDPDKAPDRDLAMEGLVEVLEGKRVVHFHTHRHDDILTAIRLSQEFGFKLVLHHVSEGYKVADEIARAGVGSSVILVDSPGGKLEAMNLTFQTPVALEKAGALFAFHTDDWITDSRHFFRMAALGVRAGLSREKALEALTLAPAKLIELDSRLGSLTRGKDADFIVLDGDPLSVYTKVLETWVEGERVFDRANPKDRLYAVGGYGAGHDQVMHMCCFEDHDH